MKNTSDQELIAKIFEDNEQALKELFSRYYIPLCKFSATIVGAKADSETIVGDLFLELWEKRRQRTINISVKNYLFAAIKNKSFNAIRIVSPEDVSSNDLEKVEILDSEDAGSSLLLGELYAELEKLIRELPSQRQLIFRMNRLEGHSYEEIAKRLSISIHTVKNQMTLAVRHIERYRENFLYALILIAVLSRVYVFNL